VTTLHEVEEALRNVDPDTLREMAFQAAESHMRFCRLTSKVGGCAHIAPDETRDRVGALEINELASILAPTAWLAVDLHHRVGI
jgi:hypothetical protein